MAILVGNTVVLITFPNKKVSDNMPYLFSIYAETGVVTSILGEITVVHWSTGNSTAIPAKDLVLVNSQDHKDLIQLFKSSHKFLPHSLVVLKENPKSHAGVVIATDWNTQSVLVEWPNGERRMYNSNGLMLFQTAFDPNFAFKQHKSSKRRNMKMSFIKSVKDLDNDDIPF